MGHDQIENLMVKSDTLYNALKSNGSFRELAEKAGVSFRALSEAQKGLDPRDLKSTRKRLGVVASFARLAAYLKIDIRVVLKELGIDYSDSVVQTHIEQALNSSSSRDNIEDYVFWSMSARQNIDKSVGSGPLVGIVPWSPFSDFDGGTSVAMSLTRSLLGSLNPEWDKTKNISLETNFQDAERRLLENKLGTPEILVGLYDLPWRRRGKVSVVTLPGLHVKVDGLCSRKIDWKEILISRGERLPHLIVVDGDVGDRLLSGPADYPAARIIKVRLDDKNRSILDKINEYVKNPPNDGFLFVADGPLVAAISDELKWQGIRLNSVEGSEWAPSYQFGFAIRSDAHEFKALLEEAISEDLFGRTFPRTAYNYITLLSNDRAGCISLDVRALNVNQDGDKKFIKIVFDYYKDYYKYRGESKEDKFILEEVENFLIKKANSRTAIDAAIDEYKTWNSKNE